MRSRGNEGIVSMASDFVHADSRRVFGRGSPVREYWLQRCVGFKVIRTDGRPLGRVSKIESGPEGAFLRLTGLRSRVIPLSAVDKVWPAASLLGIAGSETYEGARPQRDAAVTAHGTHRFVETGGHSFQGADGSSARWEEDTIPWWDLEPPANSLRANHSWAVVRRTAGHVRSGSRNRARGLARTLRRQGRAVQQAAHAALKAIQARWAIARSRGADIAARGRLMVGRLFVRLAFWAAGDRVLLVKEMRLGSLAERAASKSDDRPV
jgi:hypothetical protein